MAPINNIPALVQIMAWRRPGDKPLSEPMRRIYASLGLNELKYVLEKDIPYMNDGLTPGLIIGPHKCVINQRYVHVVFVLHIYIPCIVILKTQPNYV